jgi:uncharacterized protein (DUF58 family)
MSKSFEKFEGSDVRVVLDLDRTVHRGSGERSTLEYAVSLAASIAVTALNRNQAVGIVAGDRRATRIASARGGQQLRELLDYLAIAQADGTRSLQSVLESLAGDRGAHSLVVITPSPLGPWLDRLVEMGRFGRMASTVFHLDADSFDPAAPPSQAIGQGAAAAMAMADQLRWWNFRAGDELFQLPVAVPAVGAG